MKFFVQMIAGIWILLAAATGAMAQASGQGWLGVQVGQVTKADADVLGWEDPHGVKVLKTVPGGPAEQAGLMPGDLILSVGGVEPDDVHPSRRAARIHASMKGSPRAHSRPGAC
jgi:S1-C subfamily serine protease